METKDPNLSAKSSSTAETEAYFNSLLKSQEKEEDNKNRRRFRPISLLVLVLVVGVGLYYSVNFYINATNVNTGIDINSEEVKRSGAYFTPEYYSKRDRNMYGKISRNLNNTTDRNQAYILEDEEGQTIVYLYSESNNLDLSVGLTVEIIGELSGSTPDGKDIIKVTSIKLK